MEMTDVLTWHVSTAVLRCSGAIGGQISTDMVDDGRVGYYW